MLVFEKVEGIIANCSHFLNEQNVEGSEFL